jgi:hypothetical protein
MRRPPGKPPDGDSLIPPHGGYRKLKSFQMAELCFDVTVRFCERSAKRLLEDGGFTERMHRMRSQRRGEQLPWAAPTSSTSLPNG